MEFVLKNLKVYRDGAFTDGNIFVRDGLVCDFPRVLEKFSNIVTFDFNNCFAAPGFIDVHVHLREPGFSYKETIKTGTLAAAKGGYTTVFSMPNLNPPPTDLESLQVQTDIIKRDACINVIPYGSITQDQSGRGVLSDMDAMCNRVAAFSDDGKGIQFEMLMEDAMYKAKSLGKIIVAHCEDEDFPTEDPRSEWMQVHRDIKLAKKTGCPYHICHVSTKETVALVREAKVAGIDVTCETAPHYLVFSQEDTGNEGRFKMNPPLRTGDDRKALIEGLQDGTIDMIATDHAPHSAEEKKYGFSKSLFGVVGTETAFSGLYSNLVEKKIITLEKLIELMSVNPAKRFGVPGGRIKLGEKADITIFNTYQNITIDSENFASMGHSSPFDGMHGKGKILMTICGGNIVWEDEK